MVAVAMFTLLAATLADDIKAFDAIETSIANTREHAALGELELHRVRVLARVLTHTTEAGELATFAARHSAAVTKQGATYLVNPGPLWAAAQKYSDTASGEALAWLAATQPSAIDCASDFGCTLDGINASYGKYLELFPRGQHASDALRTYANLHVPDTIDAHTRTAANQGRNIIARCNTSERAAAERALQEIQ